MRITFIFISLLLTSLSFADTISDYAELFKDKGYDWEANGNMCEYMAREEMKIHFPEDKYEIKSGIVYKFKNNTIGELDLVVFNRATNMVDYVGEVKCWKDLQDGLDKAKKQRERFQKYVGRDITLAGGKQIYDPAQFRAIQSYFSIAQKGGLAVGFTYELNLTLLEAQQLRTIMLRCQSAGTCKKP